MSVRSGSQMMATSSGVRERPSRFNEPDWTFSFGEFRLIPARQLLLRGGAPVRLGSRALTILTALVERRGELVTKDDLMAIAWPKLFVHESNLKVNMANLRRALGDTQKEPIYVATVHGRGYQFVASVGLETSANPRLLPASGFVGRDEEIARMVAELRRRQFTCFYRYSD